jgi:intracellular multiplication protein IcmE
MPGLASRFALPLFPREFLNRAGQAGPRRLMIIGGVGLAMVAAVTVAAVIRFETPPTSKAAKMPAMNPLPGGLNSNAEQEALRLRTSQEAADLALASHKSFTPTMAASQPMPPPTVIDQSIPVALDIPDTAAPMKGRERTAHDPVTVAAPAPVRIPAAYVAGPSGIQPAAQAAPDPQAQTAYRKALDNLFDTFAGHAPRTDIVLPPADAEEPAKGGNAAVRPPVAQKASVVSEPVRPETGKLLVPAGRGIYAHSVLAVNSDTGGPLVLQADSGPIAGDRMIASFSKSGADRLVVRVTSVEHQGKAIEANAIIVAPDTMETAVASSVDEHYLERFVLPAAASFVQGLGQAIATTSNSTSVLSPLGGATTSTHLNIGQQLGVGAGTAAQQIGSALNQEAPKGPTINLAANVNLGVMFLSNLEAPR